MLGHLRDNARVAVAGSALRSGWRGEDCVGSDALPGRILRSCRAYPEGSGACGAPCRGYSLPFRMLVRAVRMSVTSVRAV
jgi:hypothetical protein